MSAEMKKGYGFTAVMMAFGLFVLYVGAKSAIVLIPAAALVWYLARLSLEKRIDATNGQLIIEPSRKVQARRDRAEMSRQH
jgi:hypothetical protein